MSSPDDCWIAVQLKRNAFGQAEAALRRQDMIVFCPKVRTVVHRFGKARSKTSLLFPGYFFTAVNLARPQWRAVANTPGVSRIVTRGSGGPAIVPPTFISALVARCDADGFVMPPRTVSPGDRIRLGGGALADLVTTVERIDERRRVWVLLEILGGVREVQVNLSEVQVA